MTSKTQLITTSCQPTSEVWRRTVANVSIYYRNTARMAVSTRTNTGELKIPIWIRRSGRGAGRTQRCRSNMAYQWVSRCPCLWVSPCACQWDMMTKILVTMMRRMTTMMSRVLKIMMYSMMALRIPEATGLRTRFRWAIPLHLYSQKIGMSSTPSTVNLL